LLFLEFSSKDILRNLIKEYSSLDIFFLMIVDEKFVFAILVDVKVANRVSLIDSGIKYSVVHYFSILDFIDSDSLVEKFGSKNNERIFIAGEICDYFEDYVRTTVDYMFFPVSSVQPAFWMLEPNQLTSILLCV